MAEGELPFRTEYAKSNRSACKLCKNNIDKDSLRMAKMVQSPHFDGKIPNWYHFSCFFKIAKVDTMGQISGLGGIRWEDQQKIQEKVEGSGQEATDGPSVEDFKMNENFKVEYAPSGRAACRHCTNKIEKGLPRISHVQYHSGDDYEGSVDYWHHVKCFIEKLPEMDAVGLVPQQLSGFKSLRKETQKELIDTFPTQIAGTKRKSKGKADSKAIKKPKVEDPEEKALREQNELIWKIRDELQDNLSTAELRLMLETNHQAVPSGESKLLDRCSDGMVFGAIEPCDTCGGQLVVLTHHYQCTGNISGWTKCTVATTEVKRRKWTIPSELKKDFNFLKKYKYQAKDRIFPKAPPTPTPSLDSSLPSSSKSLVSQDPSKTLAGFKVVILGRLSKTKAQLTAQIKSLGGEVIGTPNIDTTICISNKAELDKRTKVIDKIKECDVPVVDVEFLDDAAQGGALVKIPPHTISSWGAPRHTLIGKEEIDAGSLDKLFEKAPQKMKMKIKGAAVVDPDSNLEDTHHVLEYPAGTVYSAVLGMVDIVRGTNSYYKLQLLESDSGQKYSLFRSWGRVGTTIGGNKIENFGNSRESAIFEFHRLYEEKTGNSWHNRKISNKVPGKFYPLEIDYGDDDDAIVTLCTAGSNSKLASEIQDLVRMIFDIESMKKAMMEFEIDMKKMPLGKLSKRQIQSAYTVLNELQSEITGEKNPARLLDGSNRFYTLIPHDFGMQKPPLLDTEDIIKSKTMMLDNLMEIEVAYSLLKSGEETTDKEKDPLDIHFEKLKTDMSVLPKDSDEFQRIVDYVTNTHAVTHNQYELEVMEVFDILRHGEHKRYKPFSKLHNRMLLWHGSRVTNFVGILSQGLRIAPPEAPATGYMFGKGVYFADMVSKSANYCRTSSREPIGLMLLCEVALGNMYEKTQSEFVTQLPPGKHSTKGIGRTTPNPEGNFVMDTGAVIPMGKGTSSSTTYTSLLYNEYIVYDVAQISMKYLLKMNFKYQW